MLWLQISFMSHKQLQFEFNSHGSEHLLLVKYKLCIHNLVHHIPNVTHLYQCHTITVWKSVFASYLHDIYTDINVTLYAQHGRSELHHSSHITLATGTCSLMKNFSHAAFTTTTPLHKVADLYHVALSLTTFH